MPTVDSSKVLITDYKPHPSETMKAAQWMGTKTIELGTVPKPTITAAKDAIVRVTHCTICGSDLHMYAGELNSGMQKGDIMGHEAIGIVEDIGPEVSKIKKGDRVIILPVIACGDCFDCQKQEYSLYDSTNPSKEMENLWGGYPGDQAEWCRVPNADLTCVKAPMDVDAKKLVALADVTPTAWHGCDLAEISKGDVVGVWGCGAIGLSIQKISLFRGAKEVYAIDIYPQRLKIAASFGVIPVNINDHSNVAAETSVTRTLMRKVGLEGNQGDTVTPIITATRKFPIGMLMEKTITLRGGRLMAQKYFPHLLDIVVNGEYDPSFVITHTDDFENVSENYASFNEHKIPCGLKVCLVTEFGRS